MRQGTYKSVVNLWQHTFEDPFLDVERLEHPGETGFEDRVEVVLVVQTDEEGVGPLRRGKKRMHEGSGVSEVDRGRSERRARERGGGGG